MPDLDIKPPDVPAWVTAEPPDHGYNLTMFINNDYGDDEFDFELTRQEFLSLKDHLASLRGYPVLENS